MQCKVVKEWGWHARPKQFPYFVGKFLLYKIKSASSPFVSVQGFWFPHLLRTFFFFFLIIVILMDMKWSPPILKPPLSSWFLSRDMLFLWFIDTGIYLLVHGFIQYVSVSQWELLRSNMVVNMKMSKTSPLFLSL